MATWLMASIVFAVAALVIGGFLGWLSHSNARQGTAEEALIERVNILLPQTQCAQCGFPGCRPYAQAIIKDEAAINRCPPGGEATIQSLAELLGRVPEALDDALPATKPAQLAVIDEARCIGCALCLPACPVDAIVGAQRHLHTVIADQCTGCELCLPPCPVDCIDLVPMDAQLAHWVWPRPAWICLLHCWIAPVLANRPSIQPPTRPPTRRTP